MELYGQVLILGPTTEERGRRDEEKKKGKREGWREKQKKKMREGWRRNKRRKEGN